jgi:hypothetical protein
MMWVKMMVTLGFLALEILNEDIILDLEIEAVATHSFIGTGAVAIDAC